MNNFKKYTATLMSFVMVFSMTVVAFSFEKTEYFSKFDYYTFIENFEFDLEIWMDKDDKSIELFNRYQIDMFNSFLADAQPGEYVIATIIAISDYGIARNIFPASIVGVVMSRNSFRINVLNHATNHNHILRNVHATYRINGNARTHERFLGDIGAQLHQSATIYDFGWAFVDVSARGDNLVITNHPATMWNPHR